MVRVTAQVAPLLPVQPAGHEGADTSPERHMSSILTPTSPTSAGRRPAALLRALGDAGRTLAALVAAISNRRDVTRLLELDDRSLRDIGLLRSDVHGALETPLSRDPSVLLRLRSVERRAGARRVAARRRVAPETCAT